MERINICLPFVIFFAKHFSVSSFFLNFYLNLNNYGLPEVIFGFTQQKLVVNSSANQLKKKKIEKHETGQFEM